MPKEGLRLFQGQLYPFSQLLGVSTKWERVVWQWSIDKGPRWHEWDRKRHLLSSWLLIFKEDASFEMSSSEVVWLNLAAEMHDVFYYFLPTALFNFWEEAWLKLPHSVRCSDFRSEPRYCAYSAYSGLLNLLLFVGNKKNISKDVFIGIRFQLSPQCLQLFSSSVVRIQLSHNILTIYPIYPISKSNISKIKILTLKNGQECPHNQSTLKIMQTWCLRKGLNKEYWNANTAFPCMTSNDLGDFSFHLDFFYYWAVTKLRTF